MYRTMLACAVSAIAALASSSCETVIVNPVVAVRVLVEPGQADLSEGDDVQLNATVLDAADHTLTRAVVEWSADDRSIVRVDEQGRAHGLSPGATLVWATFADVAGSALITVLSPADCTVIAQKPKGKKDDRGKKDDKGQKDKGGDDEDEDDEEDGDDEDEDDEEDGDDEDEDDEEDGDDAEDEDDGEDGDDEEDGDDDVDGDDDGTDADENPDDDGDEDARDEDEEDDARCTPPTGA